MSDSYRTDTRSFYWYERPSTSDARIRSLFHILLTILLPIFVFTSLLPSKTFANDAVQTSDPAPLAESSADSSAATSSPPPQNLPPEPAHLLDGVKGLDFAGILSAVMPSEVILTEGLEKNALATALFDLLKYMRNNVDPRTPNEILAQVPRYKRVEMFGTWVNENSTENCYNTRAEVLLRDAIPGAKITFAPANPCQVTKGEWHDPYSDTIYKLSSAVQVDHVVPLKNAYRSGAYAWSHERRCHYANFLADNKHLLAVSGRENMVKSDRGPDEYLPPNPNYTCEYVANWMRIKAVWNLEYTADERNGIEAVLQSSNCAVSETRLSLKDLQKDRALTLRMNVKCADSNPIAL